MNSVTASHSEDARMREVLSSWRLSSREHMMVCEIVTSMLQVLLQVLKLTFTVHS